MKKSNGRRNRQFAKQAQKRRTARRPKLRAEQLEARLLLAADFDYSAHREYLDSDAYEGNTNIVDANDVNNDAKFNVQDGHLLIEKARMLMELTGAPYYNFAEGGLDGAAGEGDSAENSIFSDSSGERVFADTNGDGIFNTQDVFSTIRQMRAEGENGDVLAFSFLLYDDANPAFITPAANGNTTQGDPNSEKVELSHFTVGEDANLTFSISDLRDLQTKGVGSAWFDVAFEQGFPLQVVPRANAFHGDPAPGGPQIEGAFVFNSVNSTNDLQAGTVFPNFTSPLGITDWGTSDFNDFFTLNGETWEVSDVTLNIGGARLVAQDDTAGVVQGDSVNIDVQNNDMLDDVFTVTGNVPTSGDSLIAVFQSPPDQAPTNMTDFGSRDFQVLDATGGSLIAGIQNIVQGSKGNASINDNGTPNDTSDDTIDYAANASATGSDTFTYQYTDGFTVKTATVTVEIGEVNDPPVLSADSPINTLENTAVELTNVSVSDPDAVALPLSFTLNSTSGNLTLGSTANLTNLSGDGTTSISFDAAQADANVAFNGLMYDPIGEFSGTDTVTINVDDNGNDGVGGNQTDSIDITVNVGAVNDAPVNTVPAGPLGVFNTETLTINGLSIADIDAGGGDVTVNLSVTQGTLMMNSTTGLVASGGGTGSVTLTGTIANLNAAFGSGVDYDPIDSFIGTDTLTFDSNDNGNTGGPAETDSASVDIGVTPPRVPFARDDTLTVSEDSLAGAPNQVDAFANDLDGAVQTGGTDLTLVTFDANSVEGGSVVHLGNGVFEYVPLGDFFGSDSFTYTIEDLVNTPNDGQHTGTVNITVDPVNDAPVLTLNPTDTTPEDVDLAFTNGSTISIADIDAGTGSLTVDISSTNGTLIVNSSAVGASTQLTGTVAQLNSQLATLQFDPTADFFGNATVNISVNDNGNTGPIAESDSGTITIDVTSVNDAPVVTFPSGDAFTTKGFDFVFDSSFPVTIADVDAGSDDLTVVIDISTSDPGNIGTIDLGNPGSVNVISETDTSLTFEGTLSEINDAIDGLVYSPGQSPDFVGDVLVNVQVNDNGANGAGGDMTGSASKNVEVLDFVPSTLSGFAFIDGDKDGEKDANEIGIADTVVTLTGIDITGANVNLTMETNDDGQYTFTNLAPPLQSTAGYTISINSSETSLFKNWTDYIGTQGGTASADSLLVPTSAFIVNNQPLGGVNGVQNNFTFLGPDAQFVNPLQWILASNQGSNGNPANRLLLSVDSSGNALNWLNIGGWDGFSDFDLFNFNANKTQATLRAINGSTTQQTLNFPVIRMLGDDGQGNCLYWIEGSYNDLFSQAGSEGEGEAAERAEGLNFEDQADIEMLAAAIEREASGDFAEAVDEVFAEGDIA